MDLWPMMKSDYPLLEFGERQNGVHCDDYMLFRGCDDGLADLKDGNAGLSGLEHLNDFQFSQNGLFPFLMRVWNWQGHRSHQQVVHLFVSTR